MSASSVTLVEEEWDGACVVRVGGERLQPYEFEASFNARNDRGLFVDGHRVAGGAVKVFAWVRGFGCHIAHCTTGIVEFRYVRTGLSQGFFDFGGVAARRGGQGEIQWQMNR